ncbi:MAG: prepilin-type N-terminal cleavage/methylation domain-containing protein [bacterium]
MKRRAFTLIELLIVVAIIGILAAIAVPNFMNARTRAKIARVVGDLKAITMAMEIYRTDRNSYINESESGAILEGPPLPNSGLIWLTELGYIGSIPTDPFESKYDTSGLFALDNYEVAVAPADPNPVKRLYNINSRGPDQDEDMGARSELAGGRPVITSYTPTNGLISDGDIYLFGGDPTVLTAPLIIDGQFYTKSYPSTPRF